MMPEAQAVSRPLVYCCLCVSLVGSPRVSGVTMESNNRAPHVSLWQKDWTVSPLYQSSKQHLLCRQYFSLPLV